MVFTSLHFTSLHFTSLLAKRSTPALEMAVMRTINVVLFFNGATVEAGTSVAV